MDEVVLRRVVGVITLAIAAFLLSWLLPRPGLDRLRGEGERVVTVDLTRPDAVPQEIPPPSEPPPTPPRAPESAPTPEAEIEAAVAPPPLPEPVEAPKPVETPKPVEAPKIVEAPKPLEKPKPAPAPAPKPAEPKSVESKPADTQPKAAPAPSVGGTVMVQAGAYSHLDKAEQVRSKAGAQGQHCTISPAETAKGTLYRVRCGPYADRAQAQAAITTLGAAGITAQLVGGAR